MPAILQIGQREVGTGKAALLIAEAGVNHDGEVSRAHALIDAAADAGADAVKFQTFQASALATEAAPRAAYQSGRLGGDDTQRSMLERLELPRDAWPSLRQHAIDRRLIFISTPFDEGSLDLLLALDVPAVKIGSGDLTNTRLLARAARSGKPLLCSTGMASLGEIAEAVATVTALGGDLALLHCCSSYPAPDEELNLRAIVTLDRAFGRVTGYSDHSIGTLAPVAAVALGATIIEKHLTTDRNLPGPDHRASLDPRDWTRMATDIRAFERMAGDGSKRPQPAEQETARVARRSLAYARDLPAGETITAEAIALKRPGDGLGPSLETVVVGRRLRRAVRRDALVDLGDLE